MHKEYIPKASEGISIGLSQTFLESLGRAKSGVVLIEMTDEITGEILHSSTVKNIVTLDAGILAARLFKNSLDPSATQSNGLLMLGVGTGATGAILSPDAPQNTQRKLNTELARKAFSSTQFRNGSGVAVSYATNIVDFTTTFTEAEAVGPLNEMGLMSTFSLNPAVTNPINNGPTGYDSTIDVAGKDLMCNYISFGVLSKPATAVLSITWRLTF